MFNLFSKSYRIVKYFWQLSIHASLQILRYFGSILNVESPKDSFVVSEIGAFLEQWCLVKNGDIPQFLSSISSQLLGMQFKASNSPFFGLFALGCLTTLECFAFISIKIVLSDIYRVNVFFPCGKL